VQSDPGGQWLKQCCGSGSGAGSGRIRCVLPDPEKSFRIPDPGSPDPEWIWKKLIL